MFLEFLVIPLLLLSQLDVDYAAYLLGKVKTLVLASTKYVRSYLIGELVYVSEPNYLLERAPSSTVGILQDRIVHPELKVTTDSPETSFKKLELSVQVQWRVYYLSPG